MLIKISDLIEYSHLPTYAQEKAKDYESLEPFVALKQLEHIIGYNWCNKYFTQMMNSKIREASEEGNKKLATKIHQVLRKWELDHRKHYDRRSLKKFGRISYMNKRKMVPNTVAA